jgi:group I intron endonuclease
MVYIGMTGRKTNERWRNGEGYKHNEHFARAIEKYGWDGFKHEILWSGSSREEAERMEVELIALHKSDNREFGYNIESGGRLNVVSEETREKMRVAITGKKASEETRQKLSEAHKGKSAAWLDGEFRDEIKKKISDAKKGEKNGMYGKKMPEESKQKISENNARYWSGKRRSEETKNKLRKSHSRPYNKHVKKVRCVETGVVYPSIIDAFEQTGVDRAGICLVCNGKRQSAGGFHWSFV